MYVPQLFEDVPEIHSSFSGYEGFQWHFDEMLGPDLTGKERLENKTKHAQSVFFAKLGG